MRVRTDWLVAVQLEMESYQALPEDWDSYGAGPVRKEIASAALALAELMFLRGFSRPNTCPTCSEGVMMEWEVVGRALVLDLDGNNGFSFLYERDGEPDVEGKDIRQFLALLDEGLEPI